MSQNLPDWGRLPETLRQKLQALEWQQRRHWRDRLTGQRPFPIRLPLKPPNGKQALQQLSHYQDFIHSWRDWPGPGCVSYLTRQLATLGEQQLPQQLQLRDLDEFIAFLGGEAQRQWQHWQNVLAPLQALDSRLVDALYHRLDLLDSLDLQTAETCAHLLPQLQADSGRGLYLRALPVQGIDTKFIETHLNLLAHLSAALHPELDGSSDALMNWLGCQTPPSDWLFIRVLDSKLQAVLGGFANLRLPATALRHAALPGKNVLIVENLTSGYALPALPDTVAICGAGANLGWTNATWIQHRKLAYWGDLDTWGLHYLATVRQNQPHVQALLMDKCTLQNHKQHMALHKPAHPHPPDGLSREEQALYQDLLEQQYGAAGLEQEFIKQDRVQQALQRWLD